MEILRQASRHLARPAIVHKGSTYTYESILTTAEKISRQISQRTQPPSTSQDAPRIGLYAAPGPEYVAGTFGIWQAGCIAVPLATSHPPPELDYVMQDAGIQMVLTPADDSVISKLTGVTSPNRIHLDVIEQPLAALPGLIPGSSAHSDYYAAAFPATPAESGALIIYTSGTTGKPKGALHSHRSISAQVAGLVQAWQWNQQDTITHPLPLHHIHGIVNALYCPLTAGAQVEFLDKFSPTAIWNRIIAGQLSVFMGVPTMYALLLAAYDGMKPEQQALAAAGAAKLRLTVSGSSACPVPIMERWKAISGQYLLERYGMTEIGMALSNPYSPGAWRVPGSVGAPLPGVEVVIADDGELLVRGDNLFTKYWNKPEATRSAFTPDGFFLTGDTASLTTHAGSGRLQYSILGRTSVDIIKSGGYKISALEIEGVLLEHPDLAEVAVLGVEDEVYGEVVTALVVAKQPDQGDKLVAGLKQLCAERMAPYQAPKKYMVIESLPRNAMGKVNKKELKKTFFPPVPTAAA